MGHLAFFQTYTPLWSSQSRILLEQCDYSFACSGNKNYVQWGPISLIPCSHDSQTQVGEKFPRHCNGDLLWKTNKWHQAWPAKEPFIHRREQSFYSANFLTWFIWPSRGPHHMLSINVSPKSRAFSLCASKILAQLLSNLKKGSSLISWGWRFL